MSHFGKWRRSRKMRSLWSEQHTLVYLDMVQSFISVVNGHTFQTHVVRDPRMSLYYPIYLEASWSHLHIFVSIFWGPLYWRPFFVSPVQVRLRLSVEKFRTKIKKYQDPPASSSSSRRIMSKFWILTHSCH